MSTALLQAKVRRDRSNQKNNKKSKSPSDVGMNDVVLLGLPTGGRVSFVIRRVE